MRSPAFLTALVLGLSALTAAFSSPNNIEERLIKEKRDGGLGAICTPGGHDCVARYGLYCDEKTQTCQFKGNKHKL
ncbi:hypothetical protein WAI453_003665 [Rhynchosporium graminicola]